MGDDRADVAKAVFSTATTFDPATTHTVRVTLVNANRFERARVYQTNFGVGIDTTLSRCKTSANFDLCSP